MPTISNTPLSNCCYAGVSVYPGGEETNQYVCKDCKEPCDIHSDDALTGNEPWWIGAKYAYDEESGCGCDGAWRTVYNITGILAEQQRRDWEEFREMVERACPKHLTRDYSPVDMMRDVLLHEINAKLSSLSNPEEKKV